MLSHRVFSFILPAFGGATYGLASCYPDTWISIALSWLAIFTFVHVAHASARPSLAFGFVGLFFHAVAFHWIPYVIRFFGGFGVMQAYGLFLLFMLISSLQFLALGAVLRRLRPLGALALPFAWFLCEFLFPRMFPWALAHTQLPWKSFSVLAEVSGVYPLSFLLLLWAELIYRGKMLKLAIVAPVVLFSVLTLLGGRWLVSQVEEELRVAPELRVAVVQGNIDPRAKSNLTSLDLNLSQYRQLSRQASEAELIIWPETVLTDWTPGELIEIRGTRFDPDPFAVKPMYYGTLSYEKKAESSPEALSRRERWERDFERYNSAYAIDVSGNVLGRYHKRFLMPFGEYMPGAEWFPFLRTISPQTGNFTPGRILRPIEMEIGGQLLRIGNLICYEDLVSSLSAEAVQQGANILFNLTNDAWYGKSAAPFQHHLLASWKAVEQRRYLVRSTNTGLTGVVDPLGRTVRSLPIFEEGVLIENVALLTSRTLYSYFGDTLNWGFALLGMILCIFPSLLVGKSACCPKG